MLEWIIKSYGTTAEGRSQGYLIRPKHGKFELSVEFYQMDDEDETIGLFDTEEEAKQEAQKLTLEDIY